MRNLIIVLSLLATSVFSQESDNQNGKILTKDLQSIMSLTGGLYLARKTIEDGDKYIKISHQAAKTYAKGLAMDLKADPNGPIRHRIQRFILDHPKLAKYIQYQLDYQATLKLYHKGKLSKEIMLANRRSMLKAAAEAADDAARFLNLFNTQKISVDRIRFFRNFKGVLGGLLALYGSVGLVEAKMIKNDIANGVKPEVKIFNGSRIAVELFLDDLKEQSGDSESSESINK